MRTPFALSFVLLLALSACNTGGSGANVACRTVANCKDVAAPICDANLLECRQCKGAADDLGCKNRDAANPRCGASGRCVECTVNSDCVGTGKDPRRPTCNAQNACAGCTRSSDCLSQVCSADGSCAATTDVLFVNNRGGGCSGAHKGSSDDPFCTLTDAVNEANTTGKSLISVAPSSLPYDRVRILTTPLAGLTIIGAGTSATMVQIAGIPAEPAVKVSSGAVLTLRGVQLMSGQYGIDCDGNAEVTVRDSRIDHNANDGIRINGCKLTVDGARIYQNAQVGIRLSGATYTIQNVMVWNNEVSGIVFASASTGSLRYATVFSNGRIYPAPSGIDCGAGNNLIESSIVFDNISKVGVLTTDNQIVGCTMSTVVTNDTKAAMQNGATMRTAIDWNSVGGTNASDYDLRLKDTAVNRECCINRGPTQPPPGITTDIDGISRPQETATDIGAAEFRR